MATQAVSYLTGTQTPTQKETAEKKEGLQAQATQQAEATQLAQTQAAPAPQPTFADLQKQGVARPPAPTIPGMPTSSGMAGAATAAPAPAGTAYGAAPQQAPQPVPVYGTGSTPQISGELRSRILALMQNPSSFTDEAFQGKITREGTKIDEEYGMKDTALREEMARRGLSDSSILGGRLKDLSVGKKSAKEDVLARLGEEFAGKRDEANYRALGLGMELEKQQLEQMRAQNQDKLERERLALEREVQAGRMTMQQAELAMRQSEIQMRMQESAAERAMREREFASNESFRDRSFDVENQRYASEQEWRNSRAGIQDQQWQSQFDQNASNSEFNNWLSFLQTLGIDVASYGDGAGEGTGGGATGGGTGPVTNLPPPSDIPANNYGVDPRQYNPYPDLPSPLIDDSPIYYPGGPGQRPNPYNLAY